MARIQSANINSTGSRIDRASAEVAIANKNKKYYESFLKATTAPSVLCTYWSIDDSSTYSESTKNTKLNHNAKKFMKINKFVIFNFDSEDLEDKTTDERRLSINLAAKQSFLQPGTIIPKEGDHLVLASQGAIAKPYMVNKVIPLKFLDKEVWNIEYSESTVFTIDELNASTVKTKVYVGKNGGTNGSALIDADIKDDIDLAKTVVDKIGTKYVELFYDTEMDSLAFKPYNQHDKMYLNYYANSRMQEIIGVLKFGYDKNKLFLNNTYGFDAIEENYDKSLYGVLLDRWFEEREDVCPLENTSNGNVRSDAALELISAMDLRERIYAEYRNVPEYTSKYIFSTRLYLRPKTEHMILTRFYNSHIMLVDMFDTAGFFDARLKRSWVEYEITSPIILPVLDMYMDEDWEGIIKYCKKLKRFNPSKFNIDDYMAVPLMLICIEEAINHKTDNNNVGTYA